MGLKQYIINAIRKLECSGRLDKCVKAVYAGLILLCFACVLAFLSWYFGWYGRPYMAGEIIDLSEGWKYDAWGTEGQPLATLRTGPKLHAGETMTMYRTLDAELKEAEQAAILIRANHQSLSVYLDDAPLYIEQAEPDNLTKNPGMALHFITLPRDYPGRTLKVELTSPYSLYSGRTSPILLGSVPSLEAYALSASMRSVIMMALCLFLGFGILALTFVQTLRGSFEPQHLCLGLFTVVWALYYVCTDYIVFQFFTPVLVSRISLGLYFTFQAPLALYFYFSFENETYKRYMLPAAVLHCVFPAAVMVLQLTGLADLPRLVNVNNIFLAGLAYTAALAVLESLHNRKLALPALFLIVAYASMLWNFSVFYGRSGVVPYTYRDTYFLLALSVLISNAQALSRRYYRMTREGELLALQNRQARESYERIKTHVAQAGALKHEIKNHIAALSLYLNAGQYGEAKEYLERYAGRALPVADTVWHKHFLINAVADDFMNRAREFGIDMKLNLQAEPHHIDDPDLYSLLSNILSNALEANTLEANAPDIEPGRERFIRLTLRRQEPYFVIICENSIFGGLGKPAGKLKSTKKEAGHGYGLWTVERIAEAYDGLVDIDRDEDKNTFTITVGLKDRER